jgi:multiple antibiotic resistance protein
MDFPIKPLITLLAIVNPIGVIPFFIHFTRNFSLAQRQRTVRVASFTAFVVIAISALAGLKVLSSSASRWPRSRSAAACCC